MSTPSSTAGGGASRVLALAAACLPSLLAYNVSPSPTFLNQALAFVLWGVFVMLTAAGAPLRALLRGPAPLFAALLLLTLAAAASSGLGALPSSLGASALGTLFAALLLVAGGAAARTQGRAEDLFAAFCWGWVAAGALNLLISLLQVFAPGVTDGSWIAASGPPGRAVGNLRQPNHLSSLLLWSCIAAVALLELRRLSQRAAAALLAAFVFAVVLTASRTGLVSVLLLALWGALDRRLSRPARTVLLAAPLVYALSWLAMSQWAVLTQHSFGGSQRLAEGAGSDSRWAIWRDTLDLIRLHPWAGVGFGEFNYAWTLTPFPNRPVAFFDHTHNLPLQLLVELGLPLGLAVIGLLLWALGRAARRAWAGEGGTGVAQRCALLMVLMIGLHSLLEYPLWYSYFLLPAAWAWGFALQGDGEPGPGAARRGGRLLPALALVVIAGTAVAVLDFRRVASIFAAEAGAPPLAQRIAAGQRSLFFAHHADYAAVTSGVETAEPARAFDRATHYLLDTRLMIAWAKALAAAGRIDEARHIAARLREFHKSDAAEFFAPCDAAVGAPAASAPPFQCQPPARVPGWREFLAR